MRATYLISILLLTGCSTNSAVEPPIVDMTGVDQNRYNSDLSECQRRVNPTFSIGPVVSNCMADKGYRVLQKRG